MTSKISWVAFVPFSLAAVAIKFYETFMMADGETFFGLSKLQLDYIALGCVAVIFLFALLFCLIDRKIGQYYVPSRNIPAGIFGLVLALMLAVDGASGVFNIVSSGTFEVLDIIETVLVILSAVVFIVMGLSHFVKNFDQKRFALFYLMPAFLFALRLVRVFIGFTTISIIGADVTLMACYIFLTLFFFNYAVMLSVTKAKNAVKPLFIWGFPAVAVLAAYVVSKAADVTFTDFLALDYEVFELGLLALYIFSFVIELSARVRRRDDLDIIGLDEDDDYKKLDEKEDEDKNTDTMVVTGLDSASDDDDDDTPSSYLTTADTSDYIYRATTPEEEAARNATYALVQPDEDVDGYITHKVRDEYDDKKNKKSDNYTSRLDEIDRLILEISEDEFK